MTNPETEAGYWQPTMIEGSYWNLLNHYGWPGPGAQSPYGPLGWANEGRQYSGELKPFYLLPSGRIDLPSPSRTGVVWGPGLIGQWWSGVGTTEVNEQGAIYNGINHESGELGLGGAWRRRNIFSLRCLTQ